MNKINKNMNKIDRKIYDNLDILPEDLQGWNGKSKLFGQLIGEIRPKTIIEVGTWKGQSAINMGTSVVDLNLNTKIFCVDTWLGAVEFLTTLSHTPERNLLLKNGYPQIYYQFLSNVVHHGLEDYILPIPNTSENGFRFLKSNNIMAEIIYMPKLSDTMTEGVVAEWTKKVGDKVASGELLAEIERLNHE